MIDKEEGHLLVTLIDFGYAQTFINEDGKHIAHDEEIGFFQGNLMFSSVHQMNFKKTSRRDDLISLAYLLIYSLNNFSFPLQSE